MKYKLHKVRHNMKLLLTGLLLLSTASAMACSCNGTEERLIYSLSEMQEIDYKAIVIKDVKETYNYVYMLPEAIRSAISRDPMVQCQLSCSNLGVKIVAHVEYEKEGQLCTAKLIKPARNHNRIKLKEIVCN